jgi:hypothetical protein
MHCKLLQVEAICISTVLPIVEKLLKGGANIKQLGWLYGSALQAASSMDGRAVDI